MKDYVKKLLLPIHNRLGPLWWNTLKNSITSRVGDLLALVIGLWLVPTRITDANLGAVTPVLKLAVVLGLPIIILQLGVLKYININLSKQEFGKIKRLLVDLALLSGLYSGIVVAITYLFNDRIQQSLKIQDTYVLWWLVGVTLLSFWQPVAMACAQGMKNFNAIILTKAISPCVRFLAMLMLLRPFQISGYLAAQVVAGISLVAILLWPSRFLLGREIRLKSYRADLSPMFKYIGLTAPFTLLVALQLYVEPWLVRNRLPLVDSGAFYMASTFGNIVLWIAPAMLPFLFPLASEMFEKGKSPKKLYWQSMGFISAVGLTISLLLLIGARPILGLNAKWSIYLDYWRYLPILGLMATGTVLINTHISYAQAVRNFRYNLYYIPIMVLGMVGMILLARAGSTSLMTLVLCMAAIRILLFLAILGEESLQMKTNRKMKTA